MLKRVIRAVRQKPKAVRDQYAFFLAISLTGVIVVFWLLSLGSMFEGMALSQLAAEDESSEDFSDESLVDMISEVRQEFDELDLSTVVADLNSTSSAATTSTTSTTSAATQARQVDSLPNSASTVRIATFTATTTP